LAFIVVLSELLLLLLLLLHLLALTLLPSAMPLLWVYCQQHEHQG
jgi:hypothetical protein